MCGNVLLGDLICTWGMGFILVEILKSAAVFADELSAAVDSVMGSITTFLVTNIV